MPRIAVTAAHQGGVLVHPRHQVGHIHEIRGRRRALKILSACQSAVYPANIRVHDRDSASESECGDRAGGVVTDAGQGQ